MTQLLWQKDDGLIDVTSAFKGLTHPISELYDDLHRRGWTCTKVHVQDGRFVAEGKSLHGEKEKAYGRTDATAVGNLLVRVMIKENMRSKMSRTKLGAWDHRPFEQQLPDIAQAYAGAPVYEPKAAPAWMELAQDCGRRAMAIRMQLSIEYTDDPVPYESANDMREDVTQKRHVTITRAYAHHPVWSEQQMLDYRLVVDTLGHTVGGADWGWHGTCMAFAALAPLFADAAQKALYTELLGQTAFGTFYRQWGPQKVCFLEDLVDDAQKENKPGHTGVHPSQSIVPMAMPSVFSRVAAMTRTQQLRAMQAHEAKFGPDKSKVVHEWPDGWSMRQLQTFGDMHREGTLMGNCFSPDSTDEPHPNWLYHHQYDLEGYQCPPANELAMDGGLYSPLYSLRDPDNLPHLSYDSESDGSETLLGRHNAPPNPEYANRFYDWAQQSGEPGAQEWAKANPWASTPPPSPADDKPQRLIAGIQAPQVDPNGEWESGVPPLPDAAYLWQRENGVDPLDSESVVNHLHSLDTGVANQHPHMAKQSVVNALRGSLLGSRNNPMGHAIHYQDLMHVPADVDDPIAYWDTLEQKREAWNQAKGYAPESHKQHWAQEQMFKQWVKGANPELDDGEVQRLSKREMLHMLTEEEERIIAQDQGEQLSAEVIEHEAYEALKRRLGALTKGKTDQKVDFGSDHLFHEATHHADMYPPYLASRLRPIAHVSRHADELAEAARQDLVSHKGHGHHFRAQALKLGIPQLGPRQVSNAWLHLAPQTSQLGVIEPHVMETLGHDHQTDDSSRDYFKHERELAAGRDASGYGHVPLGAFSAGLYDLHAGGPGWHPERTPFRVQAPPAPHTVNWASQTPEAAPWSDPYWWQSTQEARDGVAKAFDRTVGINHRTDEVPFEHTSAQEPDIHFHDELDPNYMPTLGRPGFQIQGYPNRWPTAYDGTTVHVGPEGSTHAQLKDAMGLPERYDDENHGYDPVVNEGWIGHNPEMDSGKAPVERQIGSTNVGWYNGSPGPQIDYALATRQWPQHPDVDHDDDDPGGYGHAPRLAMRYDDQGNIVPIFTTQPDGTRVPYLIYPQSGERVTGAPGTSLMQHVMTTMGNEDPREVWAQDYQVGKDEMAPGTLAKVADNGVPLDQWAYIAEGALERGGMTGRQWTVTKHPYRDENFQRILDPAEEEMSALAREVTGDPEAVVQATGYWPGNSDTVSGSADIYNQVISVQYQTNELIVLHECAHLIRGAHGHDAQWMSTAHDLYTRYLGPEAGDTFWKLIEPVIDPQSDATVDPGAGDSATTAKVAGEDEDYSRWWDGETEPLTVYRGLHFGAATPEEVAAMRADPYSYWQQKQAQWPDASFNQGGVGANWTADRKTASEYALNRGGEYYEDYPESPGASIPHGVVLEAQVHPQHMDSPTDELAGEADSETRVDDGAPVALSHVWGVHEKDNGGTAAIHQTLREPRQLQAGTIAKVAAVTPSGLDPWQPGVWGKGYVAGGEPTTWQTDQAGGSPHHQDVEQQQGYGMLDARPEARVVIHPSGFYTTTDDSYLDGEWLQSMYARNYQRQGRPLEEATQAAQAELDRRQQVARSFIGTGLKYAPTYDEMEKQVRRYENRQGATQSASSES